MSDARLFMRRVRDEIRDGGFRQPLPFMQVQGFDTSRGRNEKIQKLFRRLLAGLLLRLARRVRSLSRP
jgi:hypothetical protein